MDASVEKDIKEAMVKFSKIWEEEDSRGLKLERESQSPPMCGDTSEIIRYHREET